jgi:hypothetical protein
LGDEKYFEICPQKRGVNINEYTSSHIKSKNMVSVITSSRQNNGSVGFINKNDKENLYPKETITITKDGVPYIPFFQLEEFYANPLVFCLKVRCGNYNKKAISLFLCSIIKFNHSRYSYGRKLSTNRLLKTEIPLPVDENGEPN